jgi:PadR family transcriptional regulator AphA
MMNCRIVENSCQRYVEALPFYARLESERDALDLVAICGENETHLLMLHAENLTEDFYDLSSGLAGAILLKFVNYRLRVAAVLTPQTVEQGKFHEMVIETNRGSDFRVFYNRDLAETWLLSG